MSEKPAIDPAALRIVNGHLVEAHGECDCGGGLDVGLSHKPCCGLSRLMTVTELAELVEHGAPVLPEPDYWIPDGKGHQIPQWDVPGDIVVARAGGVEGYEGDLASAERRTLAVLAAIRYARRFTTDSPMQSNERSPLWTT